MSKVKKTRLKQKVLRFKFILKTLKNDYISLTDSARYKSDEPSDVFKNWMRRKDTI